MADGSVSTESSPGLEVRNYTQSTFFRISQEYVCVCLCAQSGDFVKKGGFTNDIHKIHSLMYLFI